MSKKKKKKENVEIADCNCNEWGGDRMNENGQWICDKCEEKCSCSSEWPKISYQRKRQIHEIKKKVAKKIDTSSKGVKMQENDFSTIKKLFTGVSVDRDHCSPEEVSNVKDKTRQLVYTAKENGTTNNSTRDFKEQAVQNEEAIREFNAEVILPQGPCNRATRKIDQMPRSEYSIDHKSSEEIEDQSNRSNRESGKNNICVCGCENSEEKIMEEVCICGCGETVKLRANEAIKRDDCDYSEPCNLCSCESSGNDSSEIKSFDNKISSKQRVKEEIKNEKISQVRKPINFQVIREIYGFLLLSWNVPENISDISGYEIRVNRNIVAARVRSPTRTETVIGPLDLSGSQTNFPGLIILTLYAVGIAGEYSELSNLRIRIVNSH